MLFQHPSFDSPNGPCEKIPRGGFRIDALNHHFDDYDLTTNDDRRAVKDLLNLKFNQRCKSVENQGESSPENEDDNKKVSFEKGIYLKILYV